MSLLDRDPYTRIVREHDDGTITVYFKIPKDVYENLIDISDFIGVQSIDETLKFAIDALQEKVFGKKTYIRLKTLRRKPRKIIPSVKTFKELKDMISFISKMITNINENLSRVERIGNLVSPSQATVTPSIQPSKPSSEISVDLGELKAISESAIPEKSIEKSLEDALEDVLVVAIAEDVLEEEKNKGND